MTTGGVDYVLEARREIIVSAGAFQSPQLPMVSGLGPKTLLKGLGITVVKAFLVWAKTYGINLGSDLYSASISRLPPRYGVTRRFTVKQWKRI